MKEENGANRYTVEQDEGKNKGIRKGTGNRNKGGDDRRGRGKGSGDRGGKGFIEVKRKGEEEQGRGIKDDI